MKILIYTISVCMLWLHLLLLVTFIVLYYRSEKARQRQGAIFAIIYILLEIITNVFILKLGGII